MLDREEYVEQQFFFRTFRERVEMGVPAQESLAVLRAEVLASAKLPMAIDFMLADVKHTGMMSPSMFRLRHYFTQFQAYVVQKSEAPGGKFDFRIALRILENEAKFRTNDTLTCAGLFFYQFETLCRNKLGYQEGLAAIADDSIYDQNWKAWILSLHNELGVIDFAEMIFLQSEYCFNVNRPPTGAILFSEREGRIAHATIGRDPVYLFSALSRHLSYPEVPRQKPVNAEENLIPLLQRRIEHLENRLLLLEEELRGGVNLNRFYVKEN
ncbi:MAG: hypothetical protein LBJ67_15350 [Planctomycetaceae bacterium]|jgi:hypothetical protein|nr:hypothetical protein [Planctomycetaceae bacterium]